MNIWDGSISYVDRMEILQCSSYVTLNDILYLIIYQRCYTPLITVEPFRLKNKIGID